MITEIRKYNLSHHNTFRLNSVCDEWLEFTDPDDLHLLSGRLNGENHYIIGGGSNILLIGDYHGTMIHSRILDLEMNIESNGDMLIKAGSGLVLDDLVSKCCECGKWGFENLSGIPGEVGASAVQNVGAYGVEIRDLVDTVECYDLKEGRFATLGNEDCQYGYRDSIFKREKSRYIITFVTYRLKSSFGPKLEYGNIKNRMEAMEALTPLAVRNVILEIRDEKLPSVEMIGSAGSFFKNPVLSRKEFEDLKEKCDMRNLKASLPYYEINGDQFKIPAAWLIEQCGLKGKNLGNAGIWEKQPLVIVNRTGRATSKEIVALEKLIVDEVEHRFGVRLFPEVDHVSSLVI